MNLQRRILELERRIARVERERDDLIARNAQLSTQGVRVAIVKLAAPLAKGGTASAHLQDLNSAGDLVQASSTPVEVIDLIETFVGGSGKLGVVVDILNKWVVIQLQC